VKKTTLSLLARENHAIEPDQHYRIDRFRPEDAVAVARCFYAVYGDAYSVDTVYNPAALISANNQGKIYSIVARTPKGDVIGHCSLFVSPCCEFLFEEGQLVVLPAYRNEAIARQLVRYGLEVLAREVPAREIFGKAVCNHSISQKIGADCGFVETALEVDYIPEAAYAKEKSAAGPVSALWMFRCYQDFAHAVFLPEPYADILHFLYAGLTSERNFTKPEAHIFPDGRSRSCIHFFGLQKVARMYVEAIGEDFNSVMDGFEHSIKENGSTISQVYLPLGNPSAGTAVDMLRAKGYFLGGLLPRWFNQDGLLMQKITGTPHFDQIRLYSTRAEQLLGFIRKDWEAATMRNL
jgi:GNAT superfamily N-acetyltransferase